MKQKDALSDINSDIFHPLIRSDVEADIATAQSVLNLFTAVGNILSRVKSVLSTPFFESSKTSEA